jgi:hypothetical protein
LYLISASSAGGCLAFKYFARSAPSLRRVFTGLSKNNIQNHTQYALHNRRYRYIYITTIYIYQKKHAIYINLQIIYFYKYSYNVSVINCHPQGDINMKEYL